MAVFYIHEYLHLLFSGRRRAETKKKMKDASKQQSTETEEDMEEEEEELDEEYLDEGGEPGEDFGRCAKAMHDVVTTLARSHV